jgi:hypothetical protein
VAFIDDRGRLLVEQFVDGRRLSVPWPTEDATTLAWLEDHTLLVGTDHGVLRISVAASAIAHLPVSRDRIRDIFTVPGTPFATVLYDITIAVIDTQSGTVTAERDRAGVLAEMMNPVTRQAFSLTRTHRTIDAWSEQPYGVESGPTALSFGSDGEGIVGEFNGVVGVFAAGVRRHLTQFFAHQGNVSGVGVAVFAPGDRRTAVDVSCLHPLDHPLEQRLDVLLAVMC